MTDGPNFPTFYSPTYFGQDVETCVVCLEGIEGFKTDASYQKGTTKYSITGATTYGCVRWRHAFLYIPGGAFGNVTERRKETYNVLYREVYTSGGVSTMDNKGTVSVTPLPVPGMAPTKVFEEILLNSGFTVISYP
jgi:hypothetical protein